jgi:cell division protein FtsI/penicillin-binding protein 2
LYDRGLLAEYPPGSPFKILTGLIALQEGVVDEQPLSSATVDLVMAEVVFKMPLQIIWTTTITQWNLQIV